MIHSFPHAYPMLHKLPNPEELSAMLLEKPFEMNIYLTPKLMTDLKTWNERVRTLVRPKRYLHIIRVAHLAYHMAIANDLDCEQAFLAGLLHDLARDFTDADLMRFAPPECDLDRIHPLAVHGRAARVLLETWGFKDRIILEAVEDHTTGPRSDNPISKVVYIADVSEPGRKVNDNIRALAFEDLEVALRHSVCSKVEYLQGRNICVHPRTLEVYRWISGN